MAQIVKLKRTSIAGKVPATSNIQLGELAMNTYDGRIFFEKNTGGTETVEEIVTTDSENPITGSININGSITATSFIGSVNLPSGVISGSSQITDLTTYKETVSGNNSYNIDHNLSEQYPIVQAWNTATSQQELPTSITTNSVNQVTVNFAGTFAGIIVVKK